MMSQNIEELKDEFDEQFETETDAEAEMSGMTEHCVSAQCGTIGASFVFCYE